MIKLTQRGEYRGVMTLHAAKVIFMLDPPVQRMVLSWFDGVYADLLMQENQYLLRRLVVRSLKELYVNTVSYGGTH